MGDELTAVTLARIEGKLDLINAAMASQTSRGDDHEVRLRVLESKTTVSPKQLAGWLTLLCAVIVAAATVVALFL